MREKVAFVPWSKLNVINYQYMIVEGKRCKTLNEPSLNSLSFDVSLKADKLVATPLFIIYNRIKFIIFYTRQSVI